MSTNKWLLVADSSCDLVPGKITPEFKTTVATIPMKIIVGDTEYPDLPSTDATAMLAHMKAHKGASSSACPAPDEFAAEFRKADCVIAVTMTSGLSGTYNSAMMAKEMVLEEFPEKKIHIVDSHSTAGTIILLLREADRLIATGISFEELVAQIDSYCDSMRLLFSLASYDNLVKAGRMSRAAGAIAYALNIRAVATNTPQGTIEVLEKPRGEKKAIERIVAIMGTVKDMTNKPVVITHCNNPEGAKTMLQAIKKAYKCEVSIIETRCLTTYYTDDKGILVAL